MQLHLNEATLQSRLLTRIAWMYYVNELTQKEIGQQLGFSRVKINRLLQSAREAGIVEISVNTPPGVYVDLEQSLCERYGLLDAIVVTDAEPGDALYLALAQGAANWLASNLRDGLVIAFSQSRTLSYIPQVFGCKEPVNCTFTEGVGGLGSLGNRAPRGKNYNIVSKMAELTGGQASYIYAPTIVSSRQMRDAFLGEPSITEALELARRADIVVHSVGTITDSSLLFTHGYLSEGELAGLQARGAVGDTCGQFFDQSGAHVPHELSERMIGLTLDDLKQAPTSVIVAGGPEKLSPVRAALQGNLLNVLVTDYHTASALLADGGR